MGGVDPCFSVQGEGLVRNRRLYLIRKVRGVCLSIMGLNRDLTIDVYGGVWDGRGRGQSLRGVDELEGTVVDPECTGMKRFQPFH